MLQVNRKKDPPGFRTCYKCRNLKFLSDFSQNQIECKECRKSTSRHYRESHKQQLKDYQHRHWLELKTEVLTHYSGLYPVCTHCGFDDIRALSIDHILGGGGNHRKIYNSYGKGFYNLLKKEGYPNGYQVLCMNCQFIKRHEKEEWRDQ